MTDYDQIATEYARHRRLHPGVLSDILETAAPTATTMVLEVGCGTGNYITAIQAASGCQAFGVDPSEGMLSQAREQSSNVEWRNGKAESLPLADSSIDFVFSVDAIHHVSDRPKYFKEAFRVLRPRGKICTVTDSEEIIRQRPLSQYFPETVEIELLRYPAISNLRAILEEVGFGEILERAVEQERLTSDIQAYRNKAFSILHLIPEAAFERGIARMEHDLQNGPLRLVSRYALLWAKK